MLIFSQILLKTYGKAAEEAPHPTDLHDIEWYKPDFLFQIFRKFTVKKKISKIF